MPGALRQGDILSSSNPLEEWEGVNFQYHAADCASVGVLPSFCGWEVSEAGQEGPLVLNNSLSLQLSSRRGHGGPVSTEHHGQEIVRHLPAIRSHTIIGHEKPASHSRANFMEPIASGGLGDLHGLYLSKSVGQRD